MILVWDNGEEYSSHDVWFVDVPRESIVEANSLAAAHAAVPEHSASGILFTAKLLDWRSGELASYQKWSDYLRGHIASAQLFAEMKASGEWDAYLRRISDPTAPGNKKWKAYKDV